MKGTVIIPLVLVLMTAGPRLSNSRPLYPFGVFLPRCRIGTGVGERLAEALVLIIVTIGVFQLPLGQWLKSLPHIIGVDVLDECLGKLTRRA